MKLMKLKSRREEGVFFMRLKTKEKHVRVGQEGVKLVQNIFVVAISLGRVLISVSLPDEALDA